MNGASVTTRFIVVILRKDYFRAKYLITLNFNVGKLIDEANSLFLILEYGESLYCHSFIYVLLYV